MNSANSTDGFDPSAAGHDTFVFSLYQYTPSLPAAIIAVSLFGALTAYHAWLVLRHRSLYFTAFTLGGLCTLGRQHAFISPFPKLILSFHLFFPRYNSPSSRLYRPHLVTFRHHGPRRVHHPGDPDSRRPRSLRSLHLHDSRPPCPWPRC